MKKTLLALLLALCMLVAFTAVTVSAEETDATAHTDHCVCGGSAVGVHGHQCETITWTPLSEALEAAGLTMQTANFTVLPSGNYYLDSDVTVTAGGNVAAGTADAPGQQLTVCLNGHKITATSRVFGQRYAFTHLNVCDCSGTQDADGNWSWDGTVTAPAKTNYGMANIRAGATGCVYGGNFIGQDGGTYASCFNVCNDGYGSYPGYDTETGLGVKGEYGTAFTVYNGYMKGGKTTNTGSVINSWHATVEVNIYGGTFVGGGSDKGGGAISVPDGRLYVENATVIGAAAPYGGAINAGKGTLTIIDSHITGGEVTTSGGAIYSSSGTVTVEGSTIVGAAAPQGGAIDATSGTLIIKDSHITGGEVTTSGGAIYSSSGNVTVEGSTIVGAAAAYGGAIDATSGTLIIKDSHITGADVTTEAGAIYSLSGTVTAEGTTIVGAAAPRGGAIVVNDGSFTDCTITGGKSLDKGSLTGETDYNCGGAMVIWGTVTIKDTTVSGGQAQIGGNLYVGAAAKITIEGNTIIENGKAVGTALAQDSRKTKAYGLGGNMYVCSGGKVTMNDGVIRNGTADRTDSKSGNGGNGGNVLLLGKFYLYGGQVYGGKALANPAYRYNASEETWVAYTEKRGIGGNFHLENANGGNLLHIEGGSIYDGQANGCGGGNIYAARGDVKLISGKIWGGTANADNSTADKTAVTGGTAYSPHGFDYQVAGGSIRLQGFEYSSKAFGPRFTMTGGSVGIDADGNAAGGTVTSGGEGGNIYIYRGTSVEANQEYIALILTGGTIANGSAPSGKGGNIAGNGDYTTIGGSVVICDGSAARGGNITLYNNGTVTIEGGTISGGKATIEGGNIIVDGSNTTAHELNITGGTIKGGVASKLGGNICLAQEGKVINISGSAQIIDGTSETSNAGNIYVEKGSVLNVSGSAKISGGTSKNAGGNIYAKGAVTLEGNVTVADGTVTSSSSGNIYVNAYGTLTVKDNVVISGGTCAKEGGNIANFGVLDISGNVTVSGGTAGTYGGNIYNGSGKTLTITGGTISGGTAATVGGNICNYGVLTLQDASVSGGTAQAGGNIYFAADSSNTVSKATISDGKAVLGTDGEYGIKEDAETETETPYAMGGNVYVDKGLALTLDNCTLSGGWANYCGGSICNRGTLTVSGGSITDGSAKTESAEQKITTLGGNIYSEGTVTIEGCTVTGGKATHGGNIYLYRGTNTITGCTISDGNANQMCDGTTNGNGGNILSARDANTTITGCTITGGVGRRGGSVGAWGKVTIEDTTISDGYAIYNGGNIMTYGNGQLTLDDGTVLTGGKAENGGGAIHFSSNAGKKQTINEGVTIGMGSATAGDCVSLAGGELHLVGAPSIAQIYVETNSDKQEMIVDALTVTAPIPVEVNYAGAFAASATDKLACFENTQGYVKAYRDGKLYLDAPTAVFVSDNGSDSNPGTETAPYLTIDHAMHVVADNGTVTIVDKLTQPTWSKHGKSVVLTGGELDLTTGTSLTLGDSVQFKTVTVTMPTTAYAIYCNGFKTVIDEDVTVRYYDGTTYTTQCTESSIYGGTNEGTVTGTDLTVLAGTWGFVYGGNEKVELTGDVHLTVGGKINEGLAYVTLGHSSSTASKYLILGGSNNADINGTVYMSVNEGTTGSSIHGGSNGAVHVDNIELTVSGGEGMAIYGAGRGGAQTVDTVNFYYQGGTYEQIFGGALSKCLTGDVNLYVTGGEITRRLYGGCYSEYEILKGWTADNYVTGNINLIIGEGANISCGADYSDRGIYGHSRRGTMSNTDEEKATVIFLTKTAYENNSSKLGSVDTATKLFMGRLPVADLICYLDWSADDTADVIYANATAVKDPQNSNTGDASAISATAALTLSNTSFFYTGKAIEPATVTVSDNWLYGDVVLAYTDNTELGTGKATITGNGYSVSAEFAIVQKPDVAQVIVGDSVTTYTWLQEAVDATPANGYLKLLGGTNEDVTVSKDLYLDLNGCSITGTVTLGEGVTLYGMDSTTDDYDCIDGNGTVKVAGAGTVAVHYKTSVTGKVRRYLTYTEEDGTLSFHRIYLGITSMSLRPTVKGVGYKATFRADSKAQSMLNQADAFGYTLWVEDAEENVIGSATRGLAREKFTNSGTVSLRLQGFDVDTYGEHNIYATVYLQIGEGDDAEVITSAEYYYTLRSLIERINEELGENNSAYSETQITALQAMLEGTTAVTSWAVSNITAWQAPAAQ